MSVQAPAAPSGTFEQNLRQSEPSKLAGSAAGKAQKAELFASGAPIGWLGQDGGQWCVVTSEDAAILIEPYIYKTVLYYRNSADTSRYLSVSDGDHYVGFYNWHGARGWTYDQNSGVLTSLYTNEPLSYWSTDNGYVYANSGSGYTPLTVAFR